MIVKTNNDSYDKENDTTYSELLKANFIVLIVALITGIVIEVIMFYFFLHVQKFLNIEEHQNKYHKDLDFVLFVIALQLTTTVFIGNAIYPIISAYTKVEHFGLFGNAILIPQLTLIKNIGFVVNHFEKKYL